MLRPHRGKRRWSLAAANKVRCAATRLSPVSSTAFNPLGRVGILHASSFLGNTQNLRVLKNFVLFKNLPQFNFFKKQKQKTYPPQSFLEFVFALGWERPSSHAPYLGRAIRKAFPLPGIGAFFSIKTFWSARGVLLSLRAGARVPNFKSCVSSTKCTLLKPIPFYGRRAPQNPAKANPNAAKANAPSIAPQGHRHRAVLPEDGVVAATASGMR